MDRTAGDILGIPETSPQVLFPGDEQAITKAYRKLVMRWHPDRCGDPKANDVIGHLGKLKAAALRMIGAVKAPARTREFRAADGKLFRFRYNSSHRIDVGEVIVGDASVAYVFERDFTDIADAEQTRVAAIEYADPRMRKEMERFLPSLKKEVRQQDATVLVYSKTPDQFLLVDLIRHCGGRIDPVHAAWIVSGLENIVAYLGWAGISHGAIDATNVLVSPQYHSVALVGGWGFATPMGERPKALPGRTLSALPRMTVAGTPSDPTVDLELVRMTGRECLGDASGGLLVLDKAVPAAMTSWLIMPPSKDAFADYRSWEETLAKAYGKRRFVQWDVEPAAVYAAAA